MLDHLAPAMVQQFLNSLPAALALVNKDNEIIWVNGSFMRISTLPESEIVGKLVSSLNEEIQEMFKEGHVYLSENNKRDAYWMACMSVPLDDYRLLYCSDVTQLQGLIEDREGLKTKVAELNPVDQITGMPNRRALFQNLEQQASRSRRYGNALSIMVLRLSNLTDYIKRYGNDNANQLLLNIGQMLNDQMRWADVIGRLDKNEFLFILPETEESVTSELRDKIQEHLAHISLPGIDNSAADFELLTEFGMTQWRKGDDVALLMERVRQSLDGETKDKIAI